MYKCLFVDHPCRFIPFLYISSKGKCISYTIVGNGKIKREKSYHQSITKKIPYGSLIIISEFMIQGGCEDDLWVT